MRLYRPKLQTYEGLIEAEELLPKWVTHVAVDRSFSPDGPFQRSAQDI